MKVHVAGLKMLIMSFCVLLCANNSAHAQSMYKHMEKFLEKNFPGEGLLPTPYGADDRFRPKSYWVRIEDAQKKIKNTRKGPAWIIGGSSEYIFDDSLVPVYYGYINPQEWTIDKETKWGLTASIMAMPTADVEAAANFARESGLELSVKIDQAKIEYINLFDLIFAYQERPGRLDAILTSLREFYGDELPTRRVVMAALKVKGARISLHNTADTTAGISVDAMKKLGELGFSFERQTDKLATLEIGDDRYIAYQARVLDEDQPISSTSTATADVDQGPAAHLMPSEAPPYLDNRIVTN